VSSDFLKGEVIEETEVWTSHIKEGRKEAIVFENIANLGPSEYNFREGSDIVAIGSQQHLVPYRGMDWEGGGC
jgi:hypothetical protein